MAATEAQERWFETVVERLRAVDGVTDASAEDAANASRAAGGIALALAYGDATATVVLDGPAGGYPALKDQYARLAEALTALGIAEGADYVPPPPAARPGGRAPTPAMRAARQKHRETFAAWQDAWRTLREAGKALEVEYEIAQMRDYY